MVNLTHLDSYCTPLSLTKLNQHFPESCRGWSLEWRKGNCGIISEYRLLWKGERMDLTRKLNWRGSLRTQKAVNNQFKINFEGELLEQNACKFWRRAILKWVGGQRIHTSNSTYFMAKVNNDHLKYWFSFSPPLHYCEQCKEKVYLYHSDSKDICGKQELQLY